MSTDEYEAFCEMAMLNQKYDPWVKRREDVERYRDGGVLEFGMFEIISCEKDWWYKKFIGIQFLGLFPGRHGARDIKPTRSIGHVRIIEGRGIPIEDVKLI